MSGIKQELCEDTEHRRELQVVRNLIALGKLIYEESAACTDLTLDEVLVEGGKKSA